MSSPAAVIANETAEDQDTDSSETEENDADSDASDDSETSLDAIIDAYASGS